MAKANNCTIDYCCQAEMSGPDVQHNLDPCGLFAPRNDLSELLALFDFQSRYDEISGTLEPKENVTILQAYGRLKSSRVDEFPKLCAVMSGYYTRRKGAQGQI